MAFIEDFSLYRFIENCLYQGFFLLSLYQKRPLLTFIEKDLFHFIALLKTAFIGFYQKQPLSRIFCFITLSKMAFIKDFCLSLYWKQPLLAFIGLFRFLTLWNTAFIGLYQKRPLSRIFCFIKNCLYGGFLLYSFIKHGL